MAVALRPDGKLELWDTVADKKLWAWEMPADCRGHLRAVRFVPAGRYVAVGMATRIDIRAHLFVLDAATGQAVRTFPRWSFLDFTPDGRSAAILADGPDPETGSFEVRELASGKVVLARRIDGGIRGKYGAFAADGRVFACTTDDGVISDSRLSPSTTVPFPAV